MSDNETAPDDNATICIRMPRDLRDKIDQIAASEDRNASQLIRVTLRKAFGMTDEPQTENAEA